MPRSARSRGSPGDCARARCVASVESVLVCIGKNCRADGSQSTLDTLHELAPGSLHVQNTTCLGRCGGGPHLALRPSGEEAEAVTGAAACAALLRRCAPDCDAVLLDMRVEALRLRTEGDAAATRGQHAEAEELLSAALALRSDSHPARLSRAAARQAQGLHAAALADAADLVAADEAPTKQRARAHVLAARSHVALGNVAAAQAACLAAAAADRSITRAPEYAEARAMAGLPAELSRSGGTREA